MNFRNPLFPFLFVTSCVALLSQPSVGQDEYVPQRAKVISYPSAQNVNELYVAIMGEVAKPGTYHLDPASLKLQSVVQRAGGLTSDASTTIRVVRQGRVSQREVYSDQASTSLFPGDLLVVDSKPPAPKLSSQYAFPSDQTTISAHYEERANAEGVQIALVNVVDFPLVLRLRREDASAVKLMEGLGQPIELLANTYIITPDLFPRLSSESAKRAIHLAQGSVMVFDRDRVNRNRLPSNLPKPIESAISMGAQPALIGSPWGQSPELRNLGQRMASGSIESNEPSEPFQSRLAPESADASNGLPGLPVNERNVETTRPVGSSRPRIANLPFTGVPRITNSSKINSQSDHSAIESIPQPDDSISDQSSPLVAQGLTLDETPSPSPSAFSLKQMFVLMLIVGTLIGAAMLLRRMLESNPIDLHAIQMSIPKDAVPETQTVVPDSQAEVKSLLERLIKNELPISIEPVEFPSTLVLQGRIAQKPILRVDGPQSILKQNGPHFGPSDRSTAHSGMNEILSQVDAPETGAVRRPHFIDGERQKAAAAAASASVHQDVEAPQGDDAVKAPLAKALFQLEQGGHS